MDAGFLPELLQNNWLWAAGLAAGVFALMTLADDLLALERKETIALWLMGVENEETWGRSFCAFMDALFGAKPLSLQCILRSAAASLLAVALIWLLMGMGGAIQLRLQSDLSLGGVLVLALAVNLIADYVSLIETRYVLDWLSKKRSLSFQVLIIISDLLFSALIIWLAIWLFINSPLYSGDAQSFAEILGIFSIFSVLFYSTFLTSVWSWAYVASTWVLRGFNRWRLDDVFDVAHKPLRVLGLVAAATVFCGSLTVAAVLTTDDNGVTGFDRALCSVFKGDVCLEVAELTESEQAQLEFLLLACEGGATQECLEQGFTTFQTTPEVAARLWITACEAGDASSCSAAGVLHTQGLGVDRNVGIAAEFFRRGCEGGAMTACSNLGLITLNGAGVDRDLAEAYRLNELACRNGDANGCNNLGAIYDNGAGVNPDYQKARELFQQACDTGLMRGCVNLAVLLDAGRGGNRDTTEAARLLRLACDSQDGLGCFTLGQTILTRAAEDASFEDAFDLFKRGCEVGDIRSCTNLGALHIDGTGGPQSYEEAARLFQLSCDSNDARACFNRGIMYADGLGSDPSPESAVRFFSRACALGNREACSRLSQ